MSVNVFSNVDFEYMQQALDLAEKGRYSTRPNPNVGCVLVNHGKIVGSGWHQQAGEAHAERHALTQAGELAKGATAYVTLEPCSHFGRTAPCADGLIEGGVKKVYIAMLDPNPLVSGQGVQRLEQAGIEVFLGLLANKAHALNIGFVRRMEQGLPYVVLKMASSLDGRTAMANGESQWITGEASRLEVHKLRAISGAIITGIGTVLADNPSLTVRLLDDGFSVKKIPPPLRVVLDSNLKMPLDAKVLSSEAPTLVVTTDESYKRQADRVKALTAQPNVTVLSVAKQVGKGGGVNLHAVLQHLAHVLHINRVLVEAGATLAGAFVSENRIDELHSFIAPCLLGNQAKPMFVLPDVQNMADKIQLQIISIKPFGQDVRVVLNRP